jgi:multiple sugar transport system permease protein
MESKNNWKAWLYLAPVLILMSIFTFYPLINTFFISFLKNFDYRSGANSGFTFDNYGIVLGITEKVAGIPESKVTEFVQYALPNTFLVTFITVPISIILSLLIAIGINNVKWFKKGLQTIFFMPYVTNIIAVGMVFSVIFGDNGIFNFIFGLSGTKWVTESASWQNSMTILCLYIIWSALPYKILIFSSGLQNIDKQYYDAAKIDGSNKWKTTMKITIPLLSPQILYIMITSFIGAFKEYNAVVGLFNRNYTDSGNVHDLTTVVYYIYQQLEGNNPQMHIAAAGAVILFAIIMVFTFVQMRVSKKRVHY